MHKTDILLHRTPYAILDDERHIITVLAGCPFPKNGVPDDWDDVVVLLKLLVKKCISRRMIVSIDVALTSVKLLVGPMVGGRGFVPVAYFIA